MTGAGKPVLKYDIVVVGGGAAGAALAARLSEDPERSVLLLEAGPVPSGTDKFPSELLNAGTVQGAMPGHPNNWSFMGYLTPERPYYIARGRILGGSTSISGTYFIRARKHDFERWAAGGNDEWGWERVLPFYRKMENDLQFGHEEGHGSKGPVTVSRLPQNHPVTVAFARAVTDQGFPLEPDKNGQAVVGYGPMPTNSIGGQRINTGCAYIAPAKDRRNLTVEGNAFVRRVLFDGRRATAVEVERNGTIATIHAHQIVLAAGAVKTPHLLLLSGIGPEAELRRFGIPVVMDLPGVGKDFTDHPNVALTWRPSVPMVDYSTPQAMADVLTFTASNSVWPGDLEILPLLKPIDYMLSGSPLATAGAPNELVSTLAGPHRTLREGTRPPTSEHFLEHGDLAFLVSLQAETSRGQVSLESDDPTVQPRIDFNYLSTESDVERMREAIRVAAGILQSSAFAAIFGGFAELSSETLRDDSRLDAWIREHLGTAIHLCGTAKFGPHSDPKAVVDQYCRVHGIDGLRIADTSVLPTAPSRGPAATAILIGERVADFIRREQPLG